MHSLQKRRYQMLQSAHIFCTTNQGIFPETSLLHGLMDKLGVVLERLGELGAQQRAGIGDARGSTRDKTRARAELSAYLDTVIQTARFIARTVPQFDEPFQPPRGRSVAALLYAARLFTENAAPHSEAFIRYSMPEQFIDELNTRIKNVEQAIGNRSSARKVHKHATAAIDAAIDEGMDLIAEMDVIVSNTVRGDPVMTTLWNSARHVHRMVRKKVASATTDPSSAATV